MAKGPLSLTEGNIRKLIFTFAWPVFISSIFSELYNITNSLIVGNYVSLKALSAISACSWICNIFNYTFYGLGMGAGILVARYYGARDQHNLKKSLDSAIIFAFLGGTIITIVSELALPLLMKLCNIGADIYNDAAAYLRVYLLGSTAVLTYQMCFFILRSFGDTRHQLYYSLISSVVNVWLGLVFVRMLKMSLIGTALATIISQFVMDALALGTLLRYDEISFDLKHLDFSFDVILRICELGIPAGFQNMLIAISSMMIQSYVNLFDNEVIAGIGVAEKISGWGQMFSIAVSAALMSLVAQNLGAGKYDRVKESIRECLYISSIATALLLAAMFISAPYLVKAFNRNEEVIRIGTEMIRYSTFGLFFINLSHIYNAACRGAGNVRVPMYIAIFGQVICKFLFVYIGLKVFYDVHVLYLGTPFGYTVAGLSAALYFYTSNWTKENGLR